MLRAGLHPAPGAKPATAAEGLTFTPWWNSVGADYFVAVGLPLLRGRAFSVAEATQADGPAVAIIDDVLATGGTMQACCELVTACGGTLVGIGFLIELLFLEGRKKLPAVDIRSVVTY